MEIRKTCVPLPNKIKDMTQTVTKKMGLESQTFNFWKENKVDGFFQLTEGELSIKFIEWMKLQSKDRLSIYSTNDAVSLFIADKRGLNSVGNSEKDFAEYRTMEIILKPILRTFLQ